MSGHPRATTVARVAEAVARVVLRLYPPTFRRALGDDLVVAFVDRVEAASSHGRGVAAWALVRGTVDLAGAATLEWLHPSHTRGSSVGATAGSGQDIGAFVDHLAQDLRFAVRSLARRPGFALVAVITLALGIGATTGVFSVVNGVLLEPLPYPHPSSLVMMWSSDIDGPPSREYVAQPDIERARAVKGLAGLEGVAHIGLTLTGVDHPERIEGTRVTGGLLSLFGLRPELGRDLREEENNPVAPPVVVVSHEFWESHLDGRPDVVGTTLELSEVRYEIVGVAPAGFDFPRGSQLWTPYRLDRAHCWRGCHVYKGAVGRLAPGVTMTRAQQELSAVATALSTEFPNSNHGVALRFERLIDYTIGDVRPGLWIVLGAVSLVLLIACANMANLLLARASTRTGEVAVRSALGASRGRLILQVLTESVVLAAVGGGLGVVVAFGLVHGLDRVAGNAIPRLDRVSVNGTVLAFAAGLSLLVSLLFGLSPAVRLARTSAADQLSAAGRSGDTRREGRTRALLLATEVALSLALLSGAGLLMRSLTRLYTVDMGFDGSQVSRFTVALPRQRYDSLSTVATFFDRLEEHLRAIGGVEAVGSSFGAPLTRGNVEGEVLVDGRPAPEPGREMNAAVRSMTPGYLDAMGVTLLRGRALSSSDRGDSEPVAMANEAFVRQNFPDGDVLGKRVHVTVSMGFGSPTWTVVGVVRDVRRTAHADPEPALYVPLAQFGPRSMTVHIKTRPGLRASVLPSARRVLASLDPDVVPTNVQTVREAKRADAAPTRFYLMLVGLFAVLAVVLAAVGLYGVVAYLVSRRTREIGVRIALGARRVKITGLVFRQAAVPVLGGVFVGLGIALAGGRIMKTLLFQVQPGDPMVLAGVTTLIVGVCALAVLLPARRATRVDPVRALRSE